MTYAVRDLAELLGLSFRGDPDIAITGVAGLREALPGDLSFLAHPRYASLMEQTRASAVIVPEEYTETYAGALLSSPNPNESFQQAVMTYATPPAPHPEGVHPTAVIADDVVLGQDVGIGPNVVIQSGARIGDRCRLWAGCFVGAGVELGTDCILYPLVSIRESCRAGDRVILHGGAVIGADGFGYEVDAGGNRTKVPQVGSVWLGDDVEIGANSAVDRARFGLTRIGNGVKIDNLVQVAHNCVIGDHSVLVSQVGISGSSVVGHRSILGGQVGVSGHLVIGSNVMVAGKSGITKDIPDGTHVSGFPAGPHDKAMRLQAHMNRLPQLKKRVADLEQRLRDLEERLPPADV